MGLNTAVVYGSVRREREGIKAARFVVRKLEERGHAVTLLDPLEYRLPISTRMASVRMDESSYLGTWRAFKVTLEVAPTRELSI